MNLQMDNIFLLSGGVAPNMTKFMAFSSIAIWPKFNLCVFSILADVPGGILEAIRIIIKSVLFFAGVGCSDAYRPPDPPVDFVLYNSTTAPLMHKTFIATGNVYEGTIMRISENLHPNSYIS